MDLHKILNSPEHESKRKSSPEVSFHASLEDPLEFDFLLRRLSIATTATSSSLSSLSTLSSLSSLSSMATEEMSTQKRSPSADRDTAGDVLLDGDSKVALRSSNNPSDGQLLSSLPLLNTSTSVAITDARLRNLYEARLEMAIPKWAVEYKEGHLGDVGLKKGVFNSPRPIPGYAEPPSTDKSRNTGVATIATALWTLLSRVPGGRMLNSVLRETANEWLGQDFKNKSVRTVLSRQPELQLCGNVDPARFGKGIKGQLWRLATTAEKEENMKRAMERAIENDKLKELKKLQRPEEKLKNFDDQKKKALAETPQKPEVQKRKFSANNTESDQQPPRKKAANSKARTKLPSSASPVLEDQIDEDNVFSESNIARQSEAPVLTPGWTFVSSKQDKTKNIEKRRRSAPQKPIPSPPKTDSERNSEERSPERSPLSVVSKTSSDHNKDQDLPPTEKMTKANLYEHCKYRGTITDPCKMWEGECNCVDCRFEKLQWARPRSSYYDVPEGGLFAPAWNFPLKK